jgi:hypothetical protein
MNDTQASPRSSADAWSKVMAACSMILGILPPALTGFGYHFASLYNPTIYEHIEWALIIPGIVAIFASWSVLTNRQIFMPVIAGVLLLLAVVVLIVYLGFPLNSKIGSINIHALNWVLFYCVVAMAIALLFGFLLTLRT